MEGGKEGEPLNKERADRGINHLRKAGTVHRTKSISCSHRQCSTQETDHRGKNMLIYNKNKAQTSISSTTRKPRHDNERDVENGENKQQLIDWKMHGVWNYKNTRTVRYQTEQSREKKNSARQRQTHDGAGQHRGICWDLQTQNANRHDEHLFGGLFGPTLSQLSDDGRGAQREAEFKKKKKMTLYCLTTYKHKLTKHTNHSGRHNIPKRDHNFTSGYHLLAKNCRSPQHATRWEDRSRIDPLTISTDSDWLFPLTTVFALSSGHISTDYCVCPVLWPYFHWLLCLSCPLAIFPLTTVFALSSGHISTDYCVCPVLWPCFHWLLLLCLACPLAMFPLTTVFALSSGHISTDYFVCPVLWPYFHWLLCFALSSGHVSTDYCVCPVLWPYFHWLLCLPSTLAIFPLTTVFARRSLQGASTLRSCTPSVYRRSALRVARNRAPIRHASAAAGATCAMPISA